MEYNDIMYEKYESLLNAIRDITKAEDCSIFLLDSEMTMDKEEKKEVFDERILPIKARNDRRSKKKKARWETIEREHTDCYDILTFFVGTATHWKLKDYKTRPNKYIVFKKARGGKLSNASIRGEGLTAFTARTGKALVLNRRQEIEGHKSFNGINEGDNGVHGHCHQVAILPITSIENGGRLIGVIRCDIYKINSRVIFSYNDTIRPLQSVNDIISKIIEIGNGYENTFSYNKLFHGISLLESLKAMKGTTKGSADENVYLATKKLFYVLKRRRYFGYKAIIDRVMSFVTDTCKTLELGHQPLKTLLESFRKHEDLMLYSNKNYRDHFMHQFHVFVVGYIVLHFVGIEDVVSLLNHNLRLRKRDHLKVKNVLRIWFMAALFHDCSYLLTEFDDNIGKFLTEVLESPDNSTNDGKRRFEFQVDLKWSQLTKAEAGFLEALTEIAGEFRADNQRATHCKVTAEFGRLMIERDHGIMGALILLQKMIRGDNWKNHTAFEIEKNVASLAIALHTTTAHERIRKCVGANEPYIYFEKQPITFLLAYCDFLQEWGRRSTEKSKKLGSPFLSSLTYDRKDNTICCNLLYTPSSFERNQKPPQKNQLESWAKSIKENFSSTDYNFMVNYYHASKEDVSIEYLMNSDPICDVVNLKNKYRRRNIRYRCNVFHSKINGNEVYFTNFSYNPITFDSDIGFGTNSKFSINQRLDIKFVYDDYDLSGFYQVKRIEKAAPYMEYDNFVGAVREKNDKLH